MPIDADVRSLVGAFSSKEAFMESVAEAERQDGAFLGQKVQVFDATTSLQQSAEEVSFAAEEKVEKKLSQLRAGSKDALKTNLGQLADKYVAMMSESQPPQKLQEFLDSLKKMGGEVNEENIRQMAREQFGDVTEQYAALAFAEEALKNEGGNAQLLEQVTAAKESLMQEAGPAIRAGINIAGEVLTFAKQGLEQVERLRELYGYAILGRATVADMYKAVMKRYGKMRFGSAMEFLLRAAGNDLNAGGLGASLDSAHLEAAVNNVSFLQHMGNLHQTLEDLMNRVRKAHGR
jgi:type III secretion protein W